MSKRVLASRLALSLFGCMAIGSVSVLCAQSPHARFDTENTPGGVRQLEAGQPEAVVHPTVETMEKNRASHGSVFGSSTTSNLSYHGGKSGVGVETAPKIYLVLWGSQWTGSDPSGEEPILEKFFNGIGGSGWLNSVVQYCQGVASATVSCSGAGTPAGNQPGMLAGVWYDNASAAPTHPKQSQLASEAVKAAQHWGNTSGAINASVQYVIATAHNNNASGFGTQYCAWHSYTSSTAGNIAYTNLPYITDAGASCGANFNGLGAKAGITIVEGHELAETITDQFPSTGWIDGSGAENGDKCAWISSGSGASTNFTFSSGTFPVQSLWSNATSSCVLTF